jgi:exonuclease III
MKLATWNVNSLTVRLPQVLDWLSAQTADGGMDVLALQETKTTDDKFPKAEIEAAGYHVAFFGQKTYNGVALIAKHPITEVVHNIPGFRRRDGPCHHRHGGGCAYRGCVFPQWPSARQRQVCLQNGVA